MLVDRITFRAGPTPNSAPLAISPGTVTVIVGPNNSGKSVALQEIHRLLADRSSAERQLVQDAEFVVPEAGALELLRAVASDETGDVISCTNPFSLNGTAVLQYAKMPLAMCTRDEFSSWSQILGQVYVARLDGPSRLSLVGSQPVEDLLASPTNMLVRLFQDTASRADLSQRIHDAFGLYLAIDPTHLGRLRIRLSPRPPADESEEQSFDERSRKFHAQARPIEGFSDGVRAYTGLLAALVSLQATVLLIDEPDAFLHPPLARKLGYNVARLAAERKAQVIAATHSSEFLMGCIESGAAVQIVRLTYTKNVPTARHLPAESVRALAREPLMRSANVLAALFHEGVVVTESDNDRAFYQEINHRLLAVKDGARSCLFLHAQNKQTVQRIIQPLRSLGIPATAIVDIDILRNGGTVWGNFLDAGNVPEVTRKSLEIWRAHLNSRYKDSWKDLKRDGIAALGADDKSACEDLFKQLAAYGLVVVPVGELERWLPALDIEGKAPDWLVSVFERMGVDPDDQQYVAPAPGDVWDFVRGVAKWLADPLRKGVPA